MASSPVMFFSSIYFTHCFPAFLHPSSTMEINGQSLLNGQWASIEALVLLAQLQRPFFGEMNVLA